MAINGSLLQSGIGQTLMGAFNGPLGQYAQRPASNTNLPRTMMGNAMQRFGGSTPRISYTGPSGPAVPSQYAGAMTGRPGGFQQAPPGLDPSMRPQSPASQMTTTYDKPDLKRFVPFTGVNGQDMLPGVGGESGASAPRLFPQLGGGVTPMGGGGGQGALAQGGDWRTILAQLFPAFRGGSFPDRVVSDYFQGPAQPSFAQQFGYLA